MGMICGSTNVAVIKSQRNSMQFDAYKHELEAVCAMINNGSLGGGIFGYGSAEHISALAEVEKQIAETRKCIEQMEREEREEREGGDSEE